MRKLTIAVVSILALAGFYIAWPAYTGRVIGLALKSNDSATLERKIDFPRVRESLRPVLMAEVERSVSSIRDDGSAMKKLVAGQLKPDRVRSIVDRTIETIVTPDSIVRIARQGRTLKQAIERGLLDQITAGLTSGDDARNVLGSVIGRFTRRSGDAPASAPPKADDDPPPLAASGSERRYGLGNIKHIVPTGPLSFEVGLNRDAGSPFPELLVELAFTGLDWKVVRLTPLLDR